MKTPRLPLFVCLFLLPCLAALLFPQQAAEGNGRPDIVLYDFESGTFDGWTRTGGDTFGPRPVEPDAEMWHRLATHQQSYRFNGWQGRFMVHTNMWLSEKHHWAREFLIPSGSLSSVEFEINRRYLKFLIAGMSNPGVGVRLLIDGRPVRSAHGNNSFDLRLRGWDVSEFNGKKGRIEIFIDALPYERTMLRADFFHLSDVAPDPDAVSSPTHERDNHVLRPGLFQHVLDSTGAGSGAFGSAVVIRGHDNTWRLYAEERKTPGTTTIGWERPLNNRFFVATAPKPEGPWSPLEPILTADPAFGEEYLWMPSVVLHNGTYYLFYLASGQHRQESDFHNGETRVHLATSKDGFEWTRHPNGPLFSEKPEIGSITVVNTGKQWVLFYTAFSAVSPSRRYPAMGLFYRLSGDLVNWSRWHLAMNDQGDGKGFDGGQIAVFQNADDWFLIARRTTTQYGRTRFLFSEVWRSRDPFAWDFTRDHLGLLDAWGSNYIIADDPANLRLLHMHDHSRGVWLAPLCHKP